MHLLWVIEERLALLHVVNKFIANSLPTSGLLEEKISFGEHPHQFVHLCIPDEPAKVKRSAVFFLHGGGWNTGNPTLFRFVGHFFARKGYPTLLGGYRLAPGFHFPAQLEDVRLGLECGIRALSSKNFPIDRVIVGGHSAGAHLASLLVYDRDSAPRETVDSKPIGGLIAISGPLNFSYCTNPSLQKMITNLLGEGASSDPADPIRFITGNERVPALFMHGLRDPLVDVQNSVSFAAALSESRTCPVEVHLIGHGHHADLLAMFLQNTRATQALTAWLGQRDKSSDRIG